MQLQSLCLNLPIYNSWSHTNSLRLSSRTPSHMLKHTIYRPSKSLLQIRIIYNQKKSKVFFLTQNKGNKIWYETGESRNLFTYPVFMTSTLTETHLYSSFNLKFPYALLLPSNWSLAFVAWKPKIDGSGSAFRI